LGGLGLTVAACGAASTTSELPSGAPTTDPEAERVVRFSNWPAYIDQAEGDEPTTLDDFRASSGIEVVYTEDINDGSEFLAKVQSPLEQGRDIDRDIVVLSEETAQQFIERGFVAPLDYALIPNAVNLLPRLAAASFDPDRRFTLPWQSGFTGMGWNTALLQERMGVDRLDSLDQFFDPRLAGRVSVLSETMDTMGLMLAWAAFDPSSFTDEEFDSTLLLLQQQVDSGQIRQVTGNDYIGGLDSGDLIAVFGWSGDVLALGEGYGFGLPESGGLVWADSMLIPVVSPNQASAASLMNFYYDPSVAARLAAWIQYVCPVQGAQEAMLDVDPELVEDPWIFPPDEVLDACYVTQALSSERTGLLDRAFDRVVST